jgi:hypothetical protein
MSTSQQAAFQLDAPTVTSHSELCQVFQILVPSTGKHKGLSPEQIFIHLAGEIKSKLKHVNASSFE